MGHTKEETDRQTSRDLFPSCFITGRGGRKEDSGLTDLYFSYSLIPPVLGGRIFDILRASLFFIRMRTTTYKCLLFEPKIWKRDRRSKNQMRPKEKGQIENNISCCWWLLLLLFFFWGGGGLRAL